MQLGSVIREQSGGLLAELTDLGNLLEKNNTSLRFLLSILISALYPSDCIIHVIQYASEIGSRIISHTLR